MPSSFREAIAAGFTPAQMMALWRAFGWSSVTELGGGVGDDVTDNAAALIAAQSHAASMGGALYFPPGTYRVNSNTVVARNCIFATGARVKPANGVTVTFTGSVYALDSAIADTSLGGTVVAAGLTTFPNLANNVALKGSNLAGNATYELAKIGADDRAKYDGDARGADFAGSITSASNVKGTAFIIGVNTLLSGTTLGISTIQPLSGSLLNLASVLTLTLSNALQSYPRSTFNSAQPGAGSFLDLTINSVAAGGGSAYAGLLIIHKNRQSNATFATNTVYFVWGRDTTMNFTSLATGNGSGGGSAFSVTCPSAGVVRVTDTVTEASEIIALYVGTSGT